MKNKYIFKPNEAKENLEGIIKKYNPIIFEVGCGIELGCSGINPLITKLFIGEYSYLLSYFKSIFTKNNLYVGLDCSFGALNKKDLKDLPQHLKKEYEKENIIFINGSTKKGFSFFKDESVDFIISIAPSSGLVNNNNIHEFYRILKPEGKFYVAPWDLPEKYSLFSEKERFGKIVRMSGSPESGYIKAYCEIITYIKKPILKKQNNPNN